MAFIKFHNLISCTNNFKFNDDYQAAIGKIETSIGNNETLTTKYFSTSDKTRMTF